LPHAAAKAAAPEATEAATAAPRRIAGTLTRYEPPLTFLLPASHVAIWWRGQACGSAEFGGGATAVRLVLEVDCACRRHAERPQTTAWPASW
jgi:hypothetical protein